MIRSLCLKGAQAVSPRGRHSASPGHAGSGSAFQVMTPVLGFEGELEWVHQRRGRVRAAGCGPPRPGKGRRRSDGAPAGACCSAALRNQGSRLGLRLVMQPKPPPPLAPLSLLSHGAEASEGHVPPTLTNVWPCANPFPSLSLVSSPANSSRAPRPCRLLGRLHAGRNPP